MKNFKRHILAQYRDLLILMQEFKWSLLVFTIINLLGGVVLYRYYTLEKLDYVKAVYGVFTMIFFQPTLSFPAEWHLQILFFIIPLIGLGVVVEGFVRFGVLVVNKSMRGEAWYRVLAGTYEYHIIVCGIGHVGYRIIQELLKLGEDVVAVEKERDALFVETLSKKNVPIIFGNAEDEAIIETAGLKKAKAIVIATNNDLANLEIALNAKMANPSIRIIMRLFDARLAKKVETAIQVDMAFSTSAIAAPVAAMAAVEKGVLHSFYVRNELMSMAEQNITKGSPWKDMSIAQIEKEHDITIIVHQRENKTDFHTIREEVLLEGDKVIFLASFPTLAKL